MIARKTYFQAGDAIRGCLVTIPRSPDAFFCPFSRPAPAATQRPAHHPPRRRTTDWAPTCCSPLPGSVSGCPTHRIHLPCESKGAQNCGILPLMHYHTGACDARLVESRRRAEQGACDARLVESRRRAGNNGCARREPPSLTAVNQAVRYQRRRLGLSAGGPIRRLPKSLRPSTAAHRSALHSGLYSESPP